MSGLRVASGRRLGRNRGWAMFRFPAGIDKRPAGPARWPNPMRSGNILAPIARPVRREGERATPSVCPAEGATRPETLRQRNGGRLMGSGERLRGEPTEGVRRRFDRGPISQVTGQRGGRSLRPAAFFLFGASGKQEHGFENSTLRNARRSRAHASSTSAAGTCRSTTAPRSRNTTRCAATPACSTSRTCASWTCAARACATSCAGCSPTTSPS